jgi:hypothetical protein
MMMMKVEMRDEQQRPTTPQQSTIKKVLITRVSLASVASRSTLSSLTGSGSISSVSQCEVFILC